MAELRIACPSCGCPDQHVGVFCGFCGVAVPIPAEAVTPAGTVRVEEIIGYRAWRIRRDANDKPYLDSPVYSGHPWIPGQWMIAHCAQKPNDHHPDLDDPTMWPPVKECGGGGHGCGFYAGRTREHLINLGYGRYSEHDPHVIGEVQMAGKIIPATNGWRAQKCRPRRLYVPYELWRVAKELKEIYGPYGVEVEIAQTIVLPKEGEGAIEWCKRCKAKMGRTPTCPFCGFNHQ